jgi:hypothetical protein
MNARQILSTALLTAAAATLLGCQDRLGPTEAEPVNLATVSALAERALANVQFANSGTSSLTVLRRTMPLRTDVSASRTIGPDGGVIYLPGAGLTFVVPRGALATPVTISARAPAGQYLVYSFEPHGLVFRVPAYAAVSLRGTTARENGALLAALRAGYIADASAVDQNGYAATYQEEPVEVDGLESIAVFNVPHFSTLALASGATKTE